MLKGTALKLVREFSAQTAETSAPSASSFVDMSDVAGGNFGKMKLLADLHSFNSTPTSYIIQVWHKQGDVIVAGKRQSVTTAQGPFPELDLGAVVSGSVYATLYSLTGGSSPALTMKLYAMMYEDDG